MNRPPQSISSQDIEHLCTDGVKCPDLLVQGTPEPSTWLPTDPQPATTSDELDARIRRKKSEERFLGWLFTPKSGTGPERSRVVVAKFGGLKVTSSHIIGGRFHRYPVEGACAVVDGSEISQQVSLGRIAAGGVLGGFEGAVIGGLAKKTTGDLVVRVRLADGRMLSAHGAPNARRKAHKFADAVNRLS